MYHNIYDRPDIEAHISVRKVQNESTAHRRFTAYPVSTSVNINVSIE